MGGEDNMLSPKEYILSKWNPAHENIVSILDLKCKLDLATLASKLDDIAQYDPRSFEGLIMRFWEPRITAIVSSSGKVVCTGAKTERDAKEAAAQVASTITYARRTSGYPATEIYYDLEIEGVPQKTVKLKRVGQTCAKEDENRGVVSWILYCVMIFLVALGLTKITWKINS